MRETEESRVCRRAGGRTHARGRYRPADVSAEAAITIETVLVRSDDVVGAAIGDRLAMMDVDRGAYFVLDDVAAFIWERLERATAVGELLTALQQTFDVDRERCAADVLPFLSRIEERGIVRRAA